MFRDGYVSDYYYHWAPSLKGELLRRASGTTFAEISGSEFRKIEVPVPPTCEQATIARILDTLDTQIEKTQALIAKLEQVKEGLLHDLLTRGVDENGELRPSPEEAPELYKESPLGLIPGSWDCKRLGPLVESHQSGVYKNRLLYGEGANIVGVADLFQHDVIEGQEFRRVQVSHEERARFRLCAGDLVYAESSLVPDGIAKTVAVGPGGDGTLFAWHTRRLKLARSRADPFFVALVLGSPACRRFVISRATQTALTGIPVAAYLETPVPIPSSEEQQRIVQCMGEVVAHQRSESLLVAKLEALKSGLMDDLLTGRVRVTPLLEREAAETS